MQGIAGYEAKQVLKEGVVMGIDRNHYSAAGFYTLAEHGKSIFDISHVVDGVHAKCEVVITFRLKILHGAIPKVHVRVISRKKEINACAILM